MGLGFRDIDVYLGCTEQSIVSYHIRIYHTRLSFVA